MTSHSQLLIPAFKLLAAASPPQKEANPASLRSAAPSKGRGSRGYSLLPMEGGAPKEWRLDGGSGMKDKWGNASQVEDKREHPIHRCAVPLPQWGRQRNENTAFLVLSEQMHAYVGKQYRQTQPSPRGEGGERSEPDRVLAV